jgi:hypothetical protein
MNDLWSNINDHLNFEIEYGTAQLKEKLNEMISVIASTESEKLLKVIDTLVECIQESDSADQDII